MRVFLLNQFQSPCPFPSLYTALPFKGRVARFMRFKPNQMFEFIFFRKPFENAVNMLFHPRPKVVCVSRVKRPIPLIANNVNIEDFVKHQRLNAGSLRPQGWAEERVSFQFSKCHIKTHYNKTVHLCESRGPELHHKNLRCRANRVRSISDTALIPSPVSPLI